MTDHMTAAARPDGPPQELDLAPIKARAERATTAPWFFRVGKVVTDGSVMIGAVAPGHQIRAMPPGGSYPANDGEFIAHARQDIPALIAEVERLRAAVSASRTAQDGSQEDEIAVGQVWSAPDGRQLRVAGLSESQARIAMRNVASNRLTYMDRSNFDASQKWHLTRVSPSPIEASRTDPAVPPQELGLHVDMLDVDRLRDWARRLLVHGADVSHWASVPHLTSRMQILATQIEKEIRDVGELRKLAARVRNYLGNGGLFNPESMEHDKVRTLIMDLAAALPSSPAEGHKDQ